MKKPKQPDLMVVAERLRIACSRGVQKPIWDKVMREAQAAKRVKLPSGAAEYYKKRVEEDRAKPVEQIACESYLYWEHRAWQKVKDPLGRGFTFYDSAARRDWIEAGGKPPRGKVGYGRLPAYDEVEAKLRRKK